MKPITIFRAARILTMNPAQPAATHVAVADGRIVGVGDLDDLRHLGRCELDETLADRVLLPGFVEGHTHCDGGSVWDYAYCGAYERVDPAGRRWAGGSSLAQLIDRLRERAAGLPPGATVAGWGFEPICIGAAFTRTELDRVSDTQPVVVVHASGHVLYLNSVALERVGLLSPAQAHAGLPVDEHGRARGDVRGMELILPAAHALDLMRVVQCTTVAGVQAFGRLCVRAGITTATDLANLLDDASLGVLRAGTQSPGFPVRIASSLLGAGRAPSEIVSRALELRDESTDKLRLGRVKLVLDGSIQAGTARLLEPGYLHGAPNGLWYIAPEQVVDVLRHALGAGVDVDLHTNGDQATELALDCLEAALRQQARRDHRTTLQHAQMMNARQLERLQALGGCANFFVNHVYYYGDIHCSHTVGPERAERMNPAGTALRLGLPFAMHSDDPVTPMGPLFTAWCAVERRTVSGRRLGVDECIPVHDALRAMTLGGAYLLRLEEEIGSIEVGKRADFAVLCGDPLATPAEQLKDIPVWGTISGGVPLAAGAA